MQLLIKCFFFVITAYCAVKFCNQQTQGFTISRINSNLPYNPEWEIHNPILTDRIFEQRFTYLEGGGQCFAFVSEDGDYVLKFFKHHLGRLPVWKRYLPLPKVQARGEKLRRKLYRDFASYKLAIEELAEETGLLFVHLNKSSDLKQSVSIVDKLGIAHEIDLDRIAFVLQKRGTLPFEHFTKLLTKRDLQGVKESIDSICNLIIKRCQRGIHDEDPKILKNTGFIGNQAMIIDAGRLVYDPNRKDPAVQQQDLIHATYRLKDISPELAEYLESIYE